MVWHRIVVSQRRDDREPGITSTRSRSRRRHPCYGLEPGPAPPSRVYAYIEITPYDSIKYEVDKATGYLLVDRPQRTSSQPPTLHGFIPRTYCGQGVAALCPKVDEGMVTHSL